MDDNYGYSYKATGLIADTFKKYGIPFEIEKRDKVEVVCIRIHILCTGDTTLMFRSCDNENYVSVSICLFTHTPAGRRGRIFEAFNYLHNLSKYKMRFSLSPDGAIYMGYEFLGSVLNQSLGPMAYEIYARTNNDIDIIHQFLEAAINTEDDLGSYEIAGRPLGITLPEDMPSELRLELEQILDDIQPYIIAHKDGDMEEE